MTSPTFAELLHVRTEDEVRTELLSQLSTRGFPVTAWQSGNPGRTLVEAQAAGLVDGDTATAAIAAGAALDTAEGAWLTIHARSHYGEERQPAVFAEGYVQLVCAGGSGPYTITEGAFLVGIQAAGDVDAVRFTAAETRTLNPGQTANLLVRSESPGEAWNVANDAINFAFTPLPGVTVSNPVYSNGTWLTRVGLDEEGDASLRFRCRSKWPTLSVYGWTEGAVGYFASSATYTDGSPVGVRRVYVGLGPGDGTYPVYVAGATGTLGSPAVAAVQAYLNARDPINDQPQVFAATVVTVTVAGNVRFKTGFNTAANRAAVDGGIAAFVNANPIGTDGVSADAVEIDEAGIKAAIYIAVPGGIADVDLTSPTVDTPVAEGHVAVVNTAGLTFS